MAVASPDPNPSPITEKAIIQLAAAEGHDADIPTNQGALPSDKALELNVKSEIDIEKEAGSRRSESSLEAEAARQQDATKDEVSDPNIVFWDGDDDPENPMNWATSRQWGAVAIVSALTFFTPVGSSIFAPGVPSVMKEFHSTSELLTGFVVSVYVLGFACGPLVIVSLNAFPRCMVCKPGKRGRIRVLVLTVFQAPLSEMYGRLPVYHTCTLLFTIFNIACALSTSLDMLIVFRFLAGCVGAAPLALGGGTIADVVSVEQRAKAMSVWVMGPTVGPVLAPIAGK